MNQSETRNSIIFNDRPQIPKGTHPIETGRYLIPTNEIKRMYSAVCQWVENRTPGAIIYGKPRVGKSRAINYLMHLLPLSLGKELPIFLIGCRQHKNPNENTFFEDILRDIGHGLPTSNKPNIKRNRLHNYLVERAEASGLNRIILFFDDAQRLYELDYGWLMDINNELDRSGISLTVILVGQKELLYQRSAFIQAKKAQIVGRFMIHEHQFSGIKTLDDLKKCLNGYDNDSEYPENSNWSFTRYYFPDAFIKGFRFVNHAEDFYEEYYNLRKEKGISKPIEIPMLYIALCVEYILKRYGVNGDNLEWVSRKHWRDAIIQSGCLFSEIYQDII